jgi:glutamyl-tRNA reductase
VSVAFSAVSVTKQKVENLSDKTVIIIGTGPTAKLVARHVRACTPKNLYFINRTPENAQKLVRLPNEKAYPLTALSMVIPQADVIIGAIGNCHKLLDKSVFINCYKKSLIIDISVPAIVHPQISHLDWLTIYSIDDIGHLIQQNTSMRQTIMLHAAKWIEKGINDYIIQEKMVQSNALIKSIRGKTNAIIDAELESALKRLKNNDDTEKILKMFAYRIKNKWLHTPSVSLRNALVDGRQDLLEIAEEIFGLTV